MNTYHIFFIWLSVDGHLGWLCVCYRSLCFSKHRCSSILVMCWLEALWKASGSDREGHMENLVLAFWRTSILIVVVAELVYISISSPEGSPFPHPPVLVVRLMRPFSPWLIPQAPHHNLWPAMESPSSPFSWWWPLCHTQNSQDSTHLKVLNPFTSFLSLLLCHVVVFSQGVAMRMWTSLGATIQHHAAYSRAS